MFRAKTTQHLAKIILLTLLLVLTVMAAKGAFGATSSKKHGDSIGFIMQQNNPNTYIEGGVTNVAFVESAVNIRVQPRGMYNLFTQEILLCDRNNVAEKFQGKGGLVVLTYETVAHRTVEGIGCHELRSVDEVKSTTGELQ